MKTTAKDIMSSEVLKASETFSVEEAIKLLVNNKVTGVPVVDQEDRLVGVLSEYDILTQVLKGKSISSKVFEEKIHFTKKVITIEEGALLDQVVEQFVKTKVRRLPVVDSKGKISGMITRRDLMKVFFYRAKLGAQ